MLDAHPRLFIDRPSSSLINTVAYEVQTSTDLDGWAKVTDATAGPDGTIPYDGAPPPAEFRFYRVVRR